MKILIFSSSAGNGHNSTANRIKEKVLLENPNSEIKIIDSYKKYASKLKAWIMEDGYFLACNHFLGLYNHFFKKSEKSTYENRNKSKANKDSYCLMYGMLKEIYDFKPDVIISTYIFCSIALRNIKRVYKIPAKIMCMTLDYGISPYWECCAEGLDYMFLTDNYMVKRFKELGYKDKQLIVSGIPVAERFSEDLDKLKLREELHLDQNLFTLIIMKASFFPISNQKIINELRHIDKKIQVIVINGKNKKCELDMAKRIEKANLQHNIINVGFTNKMVEYLKSSDLVLGKAGGLTTTESINSGIPSLIIDKLPQQEIYNKQFLIEHNCALGVTKNTIADTINNLLNNPEKYKKLKDSTLKLRKFNTIDKFYEIIKNCPEPDYSGLTIKETKKQFIKNIDNARKKAINNTQN